MRTVLALLVLATLLAACVASPQARLDDAIDDIAVVELNDDYVAGWKRIGSAESPGELRVLVDHLHDERPTILLEALENVEGTPVIYTVGDALLNHLRCRFVDCSQGKALKWRQIDASPHLESKESIAAWFEEHGYDLPALKDAHAKVASFFTR